VEACDLPAEFGADGAGRAGDEYDLARERAKDLVFFQPHGVASEQILDGYFTDLGGEAVPFDDFGQAGDGLVGNAGILAIPEDFGHLRASGGGQGDENRFDIVRCDDSRQRGAGAENSDAVDEVAGFRGIVIDEADDLVAQRGILVDLAEQGDSGVTSSIDQGALFGLQIGQAGEFEYQSDGQADTPVIPKQSRKSRK